LWVDEFRYRKADGSYVLIANRSFIIRNETGKAVRMIGAMQDITEQKKAETAIREAEQRLRITLEAGELAAWDWDLITNKMIWNEQHFRLLGIEPRQEPVDPEFYMQCIYPEDRPLITSKIEETISKTGIFHEEYRIVRKNDNQLRWMNGYGRITERQNGKPTRLAGVMYDSTERRQAADALLATQNSLNTALDAAQMGVWDMNLKTGFVTRSARHDQLLGYDNWQEEWNRDKAKKYIIEEDKPKFDDAYDNMIPTGVFNLEARVKQKDGAISWIHYYGRVFKNEDGQPTHAAGVIFDITDHKTIEQKKDEFIGIASHELKTPVTSIKAYTEILQDQFEEAGEKQSAMYLSKLNGQVDRLTRLIRDLLDATRISEGRLIYDEIDVDVNQLLHETVEDMQRTTNKHRIELDLQKLPHVTGDKERLQQVLVNLLANAIKYSPDSDKVLVKTYSDNGNINIEVKDFGIGMTPETQGKVFERFFRSNDPNIATFPGLGLGLYISQQILRQHKGMIKVQSEKGKGSVFTVVLPVKE
jgi:PAS domain S-box-containing protein